MITRKRWGAGVNPAEMLMAMWQRITLRGVLPERGRKVRLFWTGLVRQHWNELPWLGQVITELAEREADGEFDAGVLRQPLDYIAEGVLFCVPQYLAPKSDGSGITDYEKYVIEIGIPKPDDARGWALNADHSHQVRLAFWLMASVGAGLDSRSSELHCFDYSVPLLRDIFGNPFRPVTFADSWRSESAISLARTAYDTRDFTLLPILADALEEAGCDSPDVLAHCREPGPHVRGCWVVDLVLGKV